MAVKKVFDSGSSSSGKKKVRAKDSGMKPLAKHYVQDNPNEEGKHYFIFRAMLTPKGFLLLMAKDFTLMYPAGMEEATKLLDDIFPKLHGKKANRLVAVLDNTNRFGAYLATDDEHQCYYSFDSVEEVLITSTEPIVNEGKTEKKGLDISDFGIPT